MKELKLRRTRKEAEEMVDVEIELGLVKKKDRELKIKEYMKPLKTLIG